MTFKMFKRPCWLVLVTSIVLIPLGYFGQKATPSLFRLLHIPYSKLGPEDLVCLGFVLIAILGTIGYVVSSVWCLIDVVVLYSRAHRGRQVKHS